MEIKVPLRVAPPPRGCERDEDPTDVPRSYVHVERDAGAVALRVESVRVPDVRGGIARIDGVAERRVEEHTLFNRDPHRSRRTVPQPDLVPGPPQDGARAVRGRSGVPVVVLAEVRPPREDRISGQRRLAVQAELHPTGTRRAPNYELRELTLFKVERMTQTGRTGGLNSTAGAAAHQRRSHQLGARASGEWAAAFWNLP